MIRELVNIPTAARDSILIPPPRVPIPPTAARDSDFPSVKRYGGEGWMARLLVGREECYTENVMKKLALLSPNLAK